MSGEILYSVISFVHPFLYFLEYINHSYLKVLICYYLDHLWVYFYCLGF